MALREPQRYLFLARTPGEFSSCNGPLQGAGGETNCRDQHRQKDFGICRTWEPLDFGSTVGTGLADPSPDPPRLYLNFQQIGMRRVSRFQKHRIPQGILSPPSSPCGSPPGKLSYSGLLHLAGTVRAPPGLCFCLSDCSVRGGHAVSSANSPTHLGWLGRWSSAADRGEAVPWLLEQVKEPRDGVR